MPAGNAARMRLRYSSASAVVVTGGRRFGITMARANWRAVCGRTAASAAPSRRCRCQSSGRVIVRVSMAALSQRLRRHSRADNPRLPPRLHGGSVNLDDLAKLIPSASWRLPEDDGDPQETQEWLDALDAVIAAGGPERATFVLKQLLQHARNRRVPLPQVLNTPYLNTISLADQAPFPGNLDLEARLGALVRWNALAMVVRANAASAELGGHIASYASAADLFEVGFNHFFRAAHGADGGDLVYFQPHSAPGVYARAFLEGRLAVEQLDNYRREARQPDASDGGRGRAAAPDRVAHLAHSGAGL